MNNLALIERCHDIEMMDDEHSILVVKHLRVYKNKDGKYDIDYIPIYLSNSLSENAMKYLKQGDLVVIKGRIETDVDIIKIIAKKITFMQSNSNKEE